MKHSLEGLGDTMAGNLDELQNVMKQSLEGLGDIRLHMLELLMTSYEVFEFEAVEKDDA